MDDNPRLSIQPEEMHQSGEGNVLDASAAVAFRAATPIGVEELGKRRGRGRGRGIRTRTRTRSRERTDSCAFMPSNLQNPTSFWNLPVISHIEYG